MSGADKAHEGKKKITFRDCEGGEVLGMTFQVTEVKKALAAVWRITEKNNIIQFGPQAHQNFIMDLNTRRKIMLHRSGGTYIVRVEFMKWVNGGQIEVKGEQVFQGLV